MPNKSILLPTAGLIVIKDNKLLLAYSNNKKAWYLPGGKIDLGEVQYNVCTEKSKKNCVWFLTPNI